MVRALRRLVAVIPAIVVLAPLAASAQPGTPPLSQGPMTLERIHNGFLVAPDVKITTVDRKTSELVGGYAGWLSDDTLFIGAGGYWMANGSSTREMGYGGLIVQWFSHSSDDRVGLSAKGLIGGGQATLGSTVTTIQPFDPRDIFPGPGRVDINQIANPLPHPITTTSTVRFREGFFVAEPEFGVFVRVARHARVTGGVSYRLIGADRGVSDGDVRLRGAAGSIALQIGGGS